MKKKQETCGSAAPPDLRPWRVLDERVVYEARPFLRLVRQRVQLPDGRVVGDYHQVQFPDYVTVIAHTADRRFLLLRKYSHGFRKTCLIFPGGMRRNTETPQQAAARELLEETGFAAGRWTCLGRFRPHSNYGCGRVHFYLADGCRPVRPSRGEELEAVNVCALSEAETFRYMRSGRNPSLSCMAALLLAAERLGLSARFSRARRRSANRRRARPHGAIRPSARRRTANSTRPPGPADRPGGSGRESRTADVAPGRLRGRAAGRLHPREGRRQA